jgi:hypothetical protein
VSWLYSTVSKDIWNDVFWPTNTAYAAWSAITGQFLDNSLQRAVYVQQEFHSLFQDDMSVGEYCGRLKSLADSLYDCGVAVSDQALVINTLRGLNNKFSQAIAVLTTMTLAPTFLYTKSYLLQRKPASSILSRWRLRQPSSQRGTPVLLSSSTRLHCHLHRPRLHLHPLRRLVAAVTAGKSARRTTAIVRARARLLPLPVPPRHRCPSGRRSTTRGRALFRPGPSTRGAPVSSRHALVPFLRPP